MRPQKPTASAGQRVVVTRELSGAEAPLRDAGVHLRVLARGDDVPSRAALLREVRGATAILSLLTERIDAEVLDAAGPGLRIVANVAAGFDNIDVDAARERGIAVSNTPGVLDEATADLAFGLILALTRRVAEADRFVRSGHDWVWGPSSFVGLDLSAGAVLGIVGLGGIGMAVARRARAFGLRIVASGSRARSDEARALEVRPASVDEVFGQADVVSLHCPLTPETRGLVGARRIASMRAGSYLVNTARGPLVDEEAVADALDSGRLAGAAFDVHEHEPSVNERLLVSNRTVLLPHIGSAGAATRRAMAELAVANVSAVLGGGPPLTPVG